MTPVPVVETPARDAPVGDLSATASATRGSHLETRPFRREGLRQRLGAFALVAIAAEASLVLPPGPVSAVDTIVGLALLVICGLAIALPWESLPDWAPVLVPSVYACSVLMLVLASGGSTSGVGTVILIPLIWTALYLRRWESVVVVAVVVAIEVLISLTPVVAPLVVIVRRIAIWSTLGLVLSFAIHGLRDRLREIFTERERLYDAQTENLRRMVAIELAVEQLASTTDPLEIVGTASRLAAELVSFTGGGSHRASYLRIEGGNMQLTALHDSMQQELAVSCPLSEYPRLQQAALTGEVSHGSLEMSALGPTMRPLMETLGITHCVCVPIEVGGEVEGGLVISMRDIEAPRDLVEQCKTVGRLIELALANARSHQRVRDAATTDVLTGLANRRRFEQLLRQRPGRGDFSLVVIDVDGLKDVNDSQGHPAGDALLKAVASALGSVLRRGDVLARIGGDEFAVLTFEADLVAARDVARRMLWALGRATVVGCTPRASIGIASGSGDDDSFAIFDAADAAMYRAKRDGGGRFWPGLAVSARR